MKKLKLGTSDAWSMRRSSHRSNNPAYYIEDCQISDLVQRRSWCCIANQKLILFMTQRLLATSQCTEVRFSSFFSGGIIPVIVVNPPERKLAKRTSVQCLKILWKQHMSNSLSEMVWTLCILLKAQAWNVCVHCVGHVYSQS